MKPLSGSAINNPLDRALELARQVKGGVAPRPAVGAVVEKNGAVIGEGATQRRPGQHAEPIALSKAGHQTKGATIYCSLEPHAFQGFAAPCTEAIINSGITRVVSPLEDPNPRVSGNGYRQLAASGIEVIRECSTKQRSEAERLIEGFAHHVKTGLPMVTLKFAASLDGKIATRTGDSQWITNEKSRQRVHEMRRQSDALITGIGTLLSDNPRLTARDHLGNATGRPALRVVIDSHGQMPASARLLKEPGEILWVVRDDVDVKPPTDSVTILKASGENGKANLSIIIEALGARGLHDVMIEAGAELTGAFINGNHVNKVTAFIAPIIIGGEDAMGAIGGQGIESLSNALSLDRVSHSLIDGDILVEGYVSSNTKIASNYTPKAE